MNCPACGAPTRVVATRSADGGASVRRRRACEECGHRVTTYERVEADRLWVRKRGGGRQLFDVAKLRASLGRAAHKRPIAGALLDELADRVAAEVERAGGELEAARIGLLCLDGLADLDRGAYLQYLGTLDQPPAPTGDDGNPAISEPGRAAGSVRAASEDA
jgi:transcriptional repressor NrdR